MRMGRRAFAKGVAATLAAGAAFTPGPCAARAAYRGPNVILVRFGGGVRRAETIHAPTTYAPYLVHRLVPRGFLIPAMTLDAVRSGATSHAEGTLNILTGRYQAYRRVAGVRPGVFEPTEPTLFEYLRRAFDIAAHEALIINGEDRPDEEHLTHGLHNDYGVAFKAEVLGLRRFKQFRLARLLAEPGLAEPQRRAATAELERLTVRDPHRSGGRQGREIEAFWERWRADYGDSGLKHPRGDRLLTELAVRAVRELAPRLVMINYQDPDYVHWGNASHYTRAIAIIDQGLERLVAVVEAQPFYRDRTVFVIVPDCGRDSNPLVSVPYQHHFNTRSAHEIWALVFGPGIVRGRVLDRPKDQTAIAPTVATLMGFKASMAEASAIEEALT